ncbi:MAG: hypothetical protein QOI89_46 [Solirubrobacteraceae bacterium]|jgi:hypothetical protein|nr:hypothetical protein [Solirubrobacteraceae bacterium]
MSEQLEYIVSLRGGAEAAKEARALAEAVDGVGGKMRAVGVHSSQAEPGVSRFEKSLRRTAIALGAVGAGYAAWNAAKSAIESTHQLAEGTSTLTRATGMSTEAASHWVGVGKALGLQTNALGTAFVKLAGAAKSELTAGEHASAGHAKQSVALRQLEERQHLALVIAEAHAAHERNQGKAAEQISAMRLRQSQQLAQAQAKEAASSSEGASAFKELGISSQFVRDHQADMGAIMDEVVGKLDHLPGGVDKAAVMTKLFGRSWQDLSPLLLEGRDHLDMLLGKAKEFGVELTGDSLQASEKYRLKMVELHLAEEGLQLGFAQLAAGPLMEVATGFIDLAKAIHTGDWRAVNADFSRLTETLVSVAEHVVPKLADAFAHAAPKVLEGLWHGFQHASLGGEAVIGAVILSKLGLTSALFGGAGKLLARGFGAAFATQSAASVAAAGAADAAVLGGETAAFAGAGALLGGALIAGLVGAGVGLLLDKLFPNGLFGSPERNAGEVQKGLAGAPPGSHAFRVENGELKPNRGAPHTEAGPGRSKHLTPAEAWANHHPNVRPYTDSHGRTFWLHPGERPPHAALGGRVMRGGSIEVGERGPEVAHMPAGALVQPLGKGSLADERPIKIDIDGKELMRVVRSEVRESQASGAGSG